MSDEQCERRCPDCGGTLHNPGDVRLGTHREWRDCIEHFKRALPAAEQTAAAERERAERYAQHWEDETDARKAAESRGQALTEMLTEQAELAARTLTTRENRIAELEGELARTVRELEMEREHSQGLQGELERVRQQPCFYCCRVQPPPLLTPLEPMSDAEADRILADAGFTEEELQQKGQAFAEQVVAAIDAHPAPSAPAEQSAPVCPDCGVDHRPFHWCSDAKRDDALRAAEQSVPGGAAGVECSECRGSGCTCSNRYCTNDTHPECKACNDQRGTGRGEGEG